MRNTLLHYMLAHPVRTSLFQKMLGTFLSRFEAASSWGLPTRIAYPSIAFASLVLVVGLSTAYTAQNALPGEALYAIKTRINEPIQGALAISNVSQVAWSSQLVDRRLSEAESLAQAGQLTPVNQMILQNAFQDATQNFDDRLSQLSQSSDVTQSESARFSFESAIGSHEAVLSALGASSSSLDNSLRPLLSLVRSHTRNHGRHGSTDDASNVAATANSLNSSNIMTTAATMVSSQEKTKSKRDGHRNLSSENVAHETHQSDDSQNVTTLITTTGVTKSESEGKHIIDEDAGEKAVGASAADASQGTSTAATTTATSTADTSNASISSGASGPGSSNDSSGTTASGSDSSGSSGSSGSSSSGSGSSGSSGSGSSGSSNSGGGSSGSGKGN